VRRLATLSIATAVLLGGACGQSGFSPGVAEDLQQQVALIRRAAEAGKPVQVRANLETLTSMVSALLEQGRLEEDRALEIAAAVKAVEAQIGLIPRTTATQAPSPSPPVEEDGDEGEDGGSGKGKGNGKGNGDEGHGNDGD
jgi:hypothetical protein